MKKIIILGINAVGVKYLPAAMWRAGCEPVFILDPENFAGEARDVLNGYDCRVVDIEDGEQVRKLFAENPALAEDAWAITSFFDEKFPLVAELAERYGLHAPEPVFARLSSKAEVARLVPEYSPASIDFPATQWRTINPSLVIPAPDGHVLKPAAQSGARGAVRVPPGATAEDLGNAIAASGLPYGEDERWILQARIEGRMVSLEGYVADGTVTFLGFSMRGRIKWTEVSNVLPADGMIPARVRDGCREAVTALVERSAMSRGYFHCEFLVARERPYLIDSNMGRPGGAGIVEQLALAHGLDPVDVFHHALVLGLPCLERVPAPAYRRVTGCVPTTSFFYGMAEGAVVESLTLPSQRKCLHTQVVPAGRYVEAVGTGDHAWVGILTGRTADALAEIDRIAVRTPGGVRSPSYAAAS